MPKSTQFASSLIRPPGIRGWRRVASLAFCALALLLTAGGVRAVERTPFDHLTTGFELLGEHRDLPCESCHVNAIFKGTPRDCASCHGVGTQVRATAKPASHILTTNACDACHTPVAWNPAVNFDHNEVQGSCSSCHNGIQATGKGPTHISTDLDCSVCHSTIGWAGAVFNHVGVTTGCAACHNGAGAKGPPSDHVPVNGAACESCHNPSDYITFKMTNASTSAPPGMVHTAVSASCSTCHEAALSWAGLPPTVLRPQYLVPSNATSGAHPATGECSNCHMNTSSFLGATGLPAGHIPLPAADGINCGLCHTTSDYTTAVMNHVNITGNCAQCHAAGLAFTGIWTVPLKAPPAKHVPVGAAPCEDCHAPSNFTTFMMTNASGTAPPAMVHTAVAGVACATCHAAGLSFIGTPATKAPPANHIPFAGAACESCHQASNTTSFVMSNATGTAPPAMVHSAVTSLACSTCHESGLTWAGAPPTVVRPVYTVPTNPASALHVTTGECSGCHFSTVSFLGASNYPSNHIPLPNGGSSTCTACHTNAANYAIYTMDHTQVTGTACATCHGAGKSFINMAPPTLKVPPTNHVPIGAAACESCHSATVFTSFVMTNASGTAPPSMVHAAVPGVACATCHGASLSWAGTPATKVLPANHVPIGAAACESCHTPTNFTTFVMTNASGTAPPSMVHTAVSGVACATCHAAGLSFVGTPATRSPPANHIPFGTAACESCHSPTTFTSFVMTNATGTAPPAMVHSVVTAIACSTCHEAGLSWAGTPATVVRPQYLVPGQASSGLHATTGECSNCHLNTTSFLGATNYPTGHIPNPGGSTGTCANCHTTGDYATYVMNHTGITNNCAACHAAGLTFAGVWTTTPLKAPPGNHVPFTNSSGTAADCSVCHAPAVFTSFVMANATGTAPPAMVHTAVSGVACATCHAAGLSFAGTPATKAPPGNHVPFGTAACDGCHSGTVTFVMTNATGTAPPSMVHSLVSSTACSTCHEAGKSWAGTPATVTRPQYLVPGNSGSGAHPTTGECSQCHLNTTSFLGAVSYPANHIPNPGGSTATCSNCHTTGDYSVYVMSHAGITNNCAQCHAYGLSFAGVWTAKALTAPPSGATGHIPTDAPTGTLAIACESCHSVTNFTTFSGTKMLHAVTNSNMVCTNCHETGMTWKTNTGVRLWVRPSGHHGTQQCNSSGGCHSTQDKLAVRRTLGNAAVLAVARGSAALGGASVLTGTTAASAAVGFDHRRVGATPCVSCHSAASGTGKPAGHIATSQSCQNCHSTVTWMPVTTVDHTQVIGTCVSCHNGTVATGMGSSHIPSSTACASCHTTNAWTPARFDHSGVVAHTCRSCHDSIHATGLPANHVVTGAQCDTCHGTLSWTPATLDHTTLTVNCVSCHNNRIALGVSPTHMSTTLDCAVCHSYPDWSVSHFVHAAATYPGTHAAAPGCSACHTSNSEQIPWPAPAEAGSCAGCHAADFTAGHHPKTVGGLQYTVNDLRNCTGACHVYSDATLGTIVKAVPGPYHRVSDVAFKH